MRSASLKEAQEFREIEALTAVRLQEFNPYHDAGGRFTSEGSAQVTTNAPNKVHDAKYSGGSNYQPNSSRRRRAAVKKELAQRDGGGLRNPAPGSSRMAQEPHPRRKFEMDRSGGGPARGKYSGGSNYQSAGSKAAKSMAGAVATEKKARKTRAELTGSPNSSRLSQDTKARMRSGKLAGASTSTRPGAVAAMAKDRAAMRANGVKTGTPDAVANARARQAFAKSDYQKSMTPAQKNKARQEMEYRNSERFGAKRTARIRQDDVNRQGKKMTPTHNRANIYGEEQAFRNDIRARASKEEQRVQRRAQKAALAGARKEAAATKKKKLGQAFDKRMGQGPG